ncbi:hypothetical protein DRQ32_03570 [bacterium]|nr:MAG: hypothetical protein DRQ32_03570 [bacterium]
MSNSTKGGVAMNGSIARRTLITLLIAVAVPVVAQAATWNVERDGSGDFSIIQDAVDASAPGDSILIGLGRFGELRTGALLLHGGKAALILWVNKPGLTIIGSGNESTIIGPSAYTPEFEGWDTGSVLVDFGADCEIRDVGMDNTLYEFTIFATTLAEDCRVVRYAWRRDYGGFVGECSGTVLRRVEFIDTGGFTTLVGAQDVLLEDCHVEDQILDAVGIHIGNGAQGCVIRNCTVEGGGTAIQFSGTGTIEDCTATGMMDAGLVVGSGSQVVATRYEIGVSRIGVFVTHGARLELLDSVIEGGTLATIASSADVYVRGSHILNAGGLTVRGTTNTPGMAIDVRDNWWGTSDPAQIEAWIYDPYGTVLWDPFNGMAIPTQSNSIGKLKGNFRGHGFGSRPE